MHAPVILTRLWYRSGGLDTSFVNSDILNPDYELKILVNERNDSDSNFLGMVLLLPAWVPNVCRLEQIPCLRL